MNDNNADKPTPDYGLALRWDDGSIEKESRLLPAEFREDYTYLKSYCRDQCQRDVDLLHERMKELGVDTDKSTWSKILRGRLLVDKYGQPLAHPVMNLEKFRECVTALRKNVRAETLQGKVGFIRTKASERIFNYLRIRWAPETVNKFGFIIGPTGSGKSATLSEFQRQNNHGACIHLEAPENGSMHELVRRIGARKGLSTQHSSAAIRSSLFRMMNHGNMVIIDNAQELWVKNSESDQPQFSFLRRLQDETKCTVILAITPVFERLLISKMIDDYFEQFIGRSGGEKAWLRLDPYPSPEDCVTIAKAFDLQDAESHKKQLAAIAREPGRIRRLFEDLQHGKRLSSMEGKPFTWRHIEEARGEL